LDFESRADEPPVMLGPRQGPLDAGRPYLQDIPSLDQVLGFQIPADLLVPVGAVLEGYTGRTVHEHADDRRACLGSKFQIPEIKGLLFQEGLETPGKVPPQLRPFHRSTLGSPDVGPGPKQHEWTPAVHSDPSTYWVHDGR